MKNTITLAALAACVAMPVSASTIDYVYSSYYAFGDSLTDDGKFGALFAPSAGGRITNGPTYAEIIADGFAVSENYALGGATAGPVNTNAPYGTSNVPPYEDLNMYATLGDQLDLFEADAPGAGDNPLVSILMGSNDIFQNALIPGYDVTETVDYVIDAIYEIADIGARSGIVFDDFIVPFTPGEDNALFGPARVAYNDYFTSRLGELDSAGFNIITPDLDAASALIDADPAAYGIEYFEACAPSFFSVTFADNCTFVGFDASGAPIYDLSLANAYTLTDPVHPSATVHAVWAEAVIRDVEASTLSAVPLPASGWLLLGGVGLLAARRKRAA